MTTEAITDMIKRLDEKIRPMQIRREKLHKLLIERQEQAKLVNIIRELEYDVAQFDQMHPELVTPAEMNAPAESEVKVS